MNSFYKAIGLYSHLSFTIEMEKSEFFENLKKITYKTNTSFITLVPDYGIPTRFEYRGTVNVNDFTIKRRRHFFDYHIFHCIIKGTVSEENAITHIGVKFTPFAFHFLSFTLVVFFFLFISVIETVSEKNYFVIVLPCVIGISQYFTLKRNIKRDKYNFEREIYYMLQKNNQFKNYK